MWAVMSEIINRYSSLETSGDLDNRVVRQVSSQVRKWIDVKIQVRVRQVNSSSEVSEQSESYQVYKDIVRHVNGSEVPGI